VPKYQPGLATALALEFVADVNVALYCGQQRQGYDERSVAI